jgi:hypothetical protein
LIGIRVMRWYGTLRWLAKSIGARAPPREIRFARSFSLEGGRKSAVASL